ncbi:MAG: hypothetical protein AABX39_00885 [Nanoarchaeota archaeon]
MNETVKTSVIVATLALSLLAIYMLVLKLTNHSPTLAEMNFAITVITLGIICDIKFHIGKFTEFSERAKEELKEIKNKIIHLETHNA